MTPVDALLDRLNVRQESFKLVVKHLRELAKERRPIVVETGCIRSIDDYGAGYSTFLWELLAREMRLSVFSIDITPANVTFAKMHCPSVNFECVDSVAALAKFPYSIDVLYLDSFDLDQKNPHPSSLHHLMELAAAVPGLKPGAWVMVDDNYGPVGKGKYVEEFMTLTGRRLLFDGVQKIWLW